MKRTLFVGITMVCLLYSCEESEKNSDAKQKAETTKNDREETKETPKKLAAINDESRPVDGAIECFTLQIELVQKGKFDEALECYSKKRKEKIAAELASNPALKNEWQAATKLSKAEFEGMLEMVRADQTFFIFEDGMWKRTDR